MTRRTNASFAGLAYLVYIGAALSGSFLIDGATRGEEFPARLASAVQHLPELRAGILLSMLGALCALVLAVTLYGITRDEDHELALFGALCRVGEGVLGFLPLGSLGILWLATATSPPDVATANGILTALFKVSSWKYSAGATLFAVGSSTFSFLLLRGRIVPAWLAWIGVVASVLLVVGLPLQLVGWLRGPIAAYQWAPMILFEVPVAFWLIFKGAAPPVRMRTV